MSLSASSRMHCWAKSMAVLPSSFTWSEYALSDLGCIKIHVYTLRRGRCSRAPENQTRATEGLTSSGRRSVQHALRWWTRKSYISHGMLPCPTVKRQWQFRATERPHVDQGQSKLTIREDYKRLVSVVIMSLQ